MHLSAINFYKLNISHSIQVIGVKEDTENNKIK